VAKVIDFRVKRLWFLCLTNCGISAKVIDFHVKRLLFLPDSKKCQNISKKTLVKISNIRFHENSFSGRCVVPCREKQTDRSDVANSRCQHLLRKHF